MQWKCSGPSFSACENRLSHAGKPWIAKKDVPRIIKGPFEESMSMSCIKNGFRKCGIHLFNPNAIEKKKLLKSQMIPDEAVDLSIPPKRHLVDVFTQTGGTKEAIDIPSDRASLSNANIRR